MKLYVNGDSHTAAAEAVVPHAFAEDDPRWLYLGRAPHPSNAAVSWARRLANTIKAVLHLDAESASSNERIRRTTREWINANQAWLPETLVIIQWSTWERQEWLLDGIRYQVTASGTDDVPAQHQQKYKQYIADLNWHQITVQEHDAVWQFHQELQAQNISHVFFNGNNDFSKVPVSDRHDWQNCYIEPYNPDMTYNQWLKNNGFRTVAPDSWHFGADSHVAWANFMLQYVVANKLMI